MTNLAPEKLKYLNRCIEKNIDMLSPEKDSDVIAELKSILVSLNDKSFYLEFSVGEDIFKEVDDNLSQLREIIQLYSSMVDLHILSEYDVIKKRMTSLLEYLATLKDLLNNEVLFNEDILKKEYKATISTLISEEKGISLTQAEKLVYADTRYSSQLRRLRPYINYAQITKTKYDYYMKTLQSVTQSVSTAAKEMNSVRMYNGISNT